MQIYLFFHCNFTEKAYICPIYPVRENFLQHTELDNLKHTVMKKRTYAWLASLLLMLVATLTSCEQFALDESGTSTHDANTNVTLHLSVANKKQSNASSKLTNSAAIPTRATDENNEEVSKPLENYCSRLSIAIFDGEEKVKLLNLKADKEGFGDITLSLDEGDYRMVAIGHNGAGNCTISSPDKVKFYKNKLTDTFYYYGKLSVEEGNDTEEEIELTRAVAQVNVHITDTVIPKEAHSIKFYYTGGSSTLDATTGYGCVKSRQTESFKLEEGQRDYAVYTFPHEDNNGLDMTVSILDTEAKIIKEYNKEEMPVKCNNITKADISIKDETICDPKQEERKDDEQEGGFGFTINPEWDGEIIVEFD